MADDRIASMDEVIIGLTAAGMRRDWRGVAEIVLIMHDQWGTVSPDDVVDAARNLAAGIAVKGIADAMTPVEA